MRPIDRLGWFLVRNCERITWGACGLMVLILLARLVA